MSVTTAAKARVATAWLDGCSGCHMSLLDIDEALAVLAGRIELVFSPLVDAQEFPENVDVALVEGAVSSQDDLKLLQTIRQRTKFLVALGDCAVTGNVPAMRNNIPVRSCSRASTSRGSRPRPACPRTAFRRCCGMPVRCTRACAWICTCRAARPSRMPSPSCSKSCWMATRST